MQNSEYVFYADESGDHSLVTIDPHYPIFVLSICGFRIDHYTSQVVPAMQRLKFRHFGHDMVVLHERDIRKQSGDFTPLMDPAYRDVFLEDLNLVLAHASFRIFSCLIDKRLLRDDFFPDNPYRLALRICLEQIDSRLRRLGKADKTCFFIFEKRGDKEDTDLELEFLRIVSGQNRFRRHMEGFRLRFADKKANSTGLQIADLTARPIGLRYLRPQQSNRAWDILASKIARSGTAVDDGRGIHVPIPEKRPSKSEGPR